MFCRRQIIWALTLFVIVVSVRVIYSVHLKLLRTTYGLPTKNDKESNPPETETEDHAKDWLAEEPSKFAIVQFEGRSPWEVQHIGPGLTNYVPTLWNIGSTYNYLYAQRHQHNYLLYHWGHKGVGCISTNNQTLAEAWCKIRAMMQVQEDFPNAEYFIYLDTDAVIDREFHSQPLQQLFYNMTTWMPDARLEY